jgi:magnesium transporter
MGNRSSFRLNLDRTLSSDLSREELSKIHDSPNEMFWLDIEAPTEDSAQLMSQILKFHPLAIEDCVHKQMRPKIEEYSDHIFIVFHGINFNPGEYLLDTIDLDIFLGSNYIVTVHDKPLQSIKVTRERLEKNPKILEDGSDRVLYRVLDEVTARYFKVIDDMDGRMDKIEDNIFENFSKDALPLIFSTKKEIMALRRLVAPQMEVLKNLTYRESPYIKSSTQLYLRDVYDETLRIFDMLESQRDLLTSALDSYLSQVSNRTNDVMKVLSIVATVMLPLSFLTGLYGTNFMTLPGADNPLGFWVLVAAMTGLSGSMIALFKKKRWI